MSYDVITFIPFQEVQISLHHNDIHTGIDRSAKLHVITQKICAAEFASDIIEKITVLLISTLGEHQNMQFVSVDPIQAL